LADPLNSSPTEHNKRVADYDALVVMALESKCGGANEIGLMVLNQNIRSLDFKLEHGIKLDANEIHLARLAVNMFAASTLHSAWRHAKKNLKQETNQ